MKVTQKIAILFICFFLALPTLSAGVSFLLKNAVENKLDYKTVESSENEFEVTKQVDEVIADFPDFFPIRFSNPAEKASNFVDFRNTICSFFLESIDPPPEFILFS